jgi:hypothetical protein
MGNFAKCAKRAFRLGTTSAIQLEDAQDWAPTPSAAGDRGGAPKRMSVCTRCLRSGKGSANLIAD